MTDPNLRRGGFQGGGKHLPADCVYVLSTLRVSTDRRTHSNNEYQILAPSPNDLSASLLASNPRVPFALFVVPLLWKILQFGRALLFETFQKPAPEQSMFFVCFALEDQAPRLWNPTRRTPNFLTFEILVLQLILPSSSPCFPKGQNRRRCPGSKKDTPGSGSSRSLVGVQPPMVTSQLMDIAGFIMFPDIRLSAQWSED